MSNIVQPSNVGFYAVAKSHAGKVLVAVGPLPASDAHRAVDSQVRPEVRARGLTFTDVGVLRMVTRPDKPLPTYSITDGRPPA